MKSVVTTFIIHYCKQNLYTLFPFVKSEMYLSKVFTGNAVFIGTHVDCGLYRAILNTHAYTDVLFPDSHNSLDRKVELQSKLP